METSLPGPPYSLLPLLPSPLANAAAPSIPAPAAAPHGWKSRTHVFPAAYPRSHVGCTSPPVPSPHIVPDERAQRLLDFLLWEMHCASLGAEFYPPSTPAAAAQKAAELASRSGEQALWGAVQRWTNAAEAANPEAIVVVAGHANGFHKETYDPIFARLVQQCKVPIAEVWSMDTVDSGFAGALNAGKLGWVVPWEDQGRDFLALLAHLPAPGEAVPAKLALPSPSSLEYETAPKPAGGRRIFALGHSYSAAGWLWAAHMRPNAIDGIMLIDGVLPDLDMSTYLPPVKDFFIARGAVARKDVFESLEAVSTNLRSKPFFQTFDPRCLDLYIKHAFQPLSSPSSSTAVTLAMSKFREAATFGSTWTAGFAVSAALQCRHAGRLHAVRMRQTTVPVASVQTYKEFGAEVHEFEGGHLVCQEQPDLIADHTARLLERWFAPQSTQQKAHL